MQAEMRGARSASGYETRKRRRVQQVSIAVLWILTALVYSNSFRSGFPRDNSVLILEDTRIREVTRGNLELILTMNYWYPMLTSGLYRPVTTLSFLVNYAVLGNGRNPAGYHAVNLALQGLNVALVYLLLCRLLGNPGVAFGATAVWAVHPLLTESVTNIAGRADLLSGAALLGALLCHIRTSPPAGRWYPFTTMAVLTTLGIFAKENVLILPVLMAAYDLTFRDRERVRTLWPGYLAVILPMLFCWAVRSRILLQYPHPFVDNPIVGAAFWTARLTAVKVIGKYLWLLIFPLRLSSDYSYNQIPLFSGRLNRWEDWSAILAALACGLLAAIAIYCCRRHKPMFFLFLFSVVTFLPTANLLLPIGSIMAERFMYLSAIGFAAWVVAGVTALGRHCRIPALAPALVSVLCIGFGCRAFARNFDWKDEETTASHDITVCPDSFRTHMSLAIALAAKDPPELDRAISEIEDSIRIVNHLPDSRNLVSPYNKAGEIYRRKGEQEDAKPVSAGEHGAGWYIRSRDILLRAVSIDQEANRRFRRQRMLSGIEPSRIPDVGIPNVYYQLGLTWFRLHEPRKAIESYLYGQRLAPTSPEFYGLIANAYAELHDYQQEAITILEGNAIAPDDTRLLDLLPYVYSKIDTGGCPALARDSKSGHIRMNLSCRAVREHVCAAREYLVRLMLETKQEGDADRLRQEAIADLHCAPGQFEFTLPREPAN